MRGFKLMSWVVLAAMILLILVMLTIVIHRLDTGAFERDQQAAEISALQAGLDEANARLEDRGEEPVPVPDLEGSTPVPVMPVAPTQEQILSAFDVWCGENECRGEDGDDAPRMTQAQLFEGFSTWCSTDPRCVGTPGTDGAKGRPPTAEEVLQAVRAVCETGDACRGPSGKDGSPGTPGKDAPRIVSAECVTRSNDLIFRMSDGTALTAANACSPPAAAPTPAPATTKGK
jgi:hypothetical protein